MKFTRSQLADYIVANPGEQATQQVAGYLVSSGRSKEVELVIREVEDRLDNKGHTVARVKSTHKLDAEERKHIERTVKKQNTTTQSVEIINEIDPSLLGGVVVRTPKNEVDVSIRDRLNRMKRV